MSSSMSASMRMTAPVSVRTPRSTSTPAADRCGSPRWRRTAAACAGVAASRAMATSAVRLPSRRSSPAGLPVTDGSPKTPRTSSRSWKASPSGSP